MIIGDDHGYPYFGFMGARYVQTPNMGELASSGTVFINGNVPDNHCRPSLATLITGMLPIDDNKIVGKMLSKKNILDVVLKREFGHQAMKYFLTLPQ